MALSAEKIAQIAQETDALLSEQVNSIIAEQERKYPDAVITIPRNVRVDQKRPAPVSIGHKGNTRPVTKADSDAATKPEALAATGKGNGKK